jgi:trigger factor
VKEEIQAYWDSQSRNQLQHSLYHVLLDHTKIEFPESFLKRWMQTGGEKPKSQAEVEQEFPTFVNQLKWTLIVDKIVRRMGDRSKPGRYQGICPAAIVRLYGRCRQALKNNPGSPIMYSG